MAGQLMGLIMTFRKHPLAELLVGLLVLRAGLLHIFSPATSLTAGLFELVGATGGAINLAAMAVGLLVLVPLALGSIVNLRG